MNLLQQKPENLLQQKPEPETCKGLIYKADVQHCTTQKGFMFSIRMNKMKKLSCPGCRRCLCIEDQLSEIDVKHWPVENVCDVEPDKLYSLEICNVGRDWETGIVDEWYLGLSPLKE